MLIQTLKLLIQNIEHIHLKIENNLSHLFTNQRYLRVGQIERHNVNIMWSIQR